MAESYKGFMIVEDPPGVVKAYRHSSYFDSGTASYEDVTHIGIREQIDAAEDSGEYTVEELALAEIGTGLTDAVMAKLYYATKNKVEDVGRTLTPEEIAEVITNVTGWDVRSDEEAAWHAEAYALIEERGAHRAAGDTFSLPEVKRQYGTIIQVGEVMVKVPQLPDWDLNYIEFPPGEAMRYRDALMKQRVKIRKVTNMRIYYEE